MFYYMNFIQQTNVWWLRRVRPIWLGGWFLYGTYLFYRYYFFGKFSAMAQSKLTQEEMDRRAAINKRNFGFNSYYKPKLQRSRKKIIMEAMGDTYDYAYAFQDRLLVMEGFEDLESRIAEENDY